MQPWPYPFWIAHRGAGTLAPENTLAAFRLGAAHGYRAFECDVKLSADGVPFLLHDSTLDRTTNGTGMAAELDWRDLSQLDAGSWHGRHHAGEPPPTLQAVATWLLANGLHLDLEIKPTPGHERETGRVVARAAAGLWQGQAVPPLLSSFRPEALAGAQEAAPALPRALLVDSLWPDWLDVAQSLGCVAVICKHTLADPALVRSVHGASMQVLAYTVNDAQEAQRLQTLGLAGLVTDAVDRFSPAR
jgi:glycerophosphoryl diester phosphodiesterase